MVGRGIQGFGQIMCLVIGAMAAVVLLSSCHGGSHLTFVVDVTSDLPDADPGDGMCEVTGSGECSLRAAIMEANAQSPGTAVEIHLAPSEVYPLSRVGADDTSVAGDLDVHTDLTIIGGGATIDAAAIENRVFEHHVGRLVLRDLTVANGVSSLYASVPEGDRGGGILNRADLWLDGVLLEHNRTGQGGAAIHQVGGTTTLIRSRVHRSSGGFSNEWAAVYADSGSVTLVQSVVSSTNPASFGRYLTTSDYAGVRLDSGTALLAFTSIHRTKPSASPFGDCGGCVGDAIRSDGAVTMSRSTLVDNDTDITGSGTFDVAGSVLETCAVVVTSGGYNHDTDGSCLGAGTTGDVSSTDAVLQPDAAVFPIAYRPIDGSSVVDAIPIGTAGLCDSPGLADQRGAPQPSGVGCDMGAVERQPLDP